ncbi:MAG: HAMP domain-containing sensor histidine kinase, partial [Planctomycetota bacterium]
TRTQVSLDDPATPDAARAVLRENQRALRRLARTVDNVVAWTIPRPPGGGPGPVDACEALAGRLVAEEAGAADKGVFFDAERRGLCPVALDAEELVLAVRNLVSNAIAWTPPGGAVTLVVERECEGGAVRVVVDDDGPGVPEDAYAEIFSPFRKRGEHAGAYGLGLALVRAIAERAGGAVEVRRSPSGGARFTLTLPAAAGGRRAE